MKKLENKVIAITGAGGIICSAFAKALAKEGAKVALLDINYDAAKKYADEIGENAIAIRCNCLDKESIIQAKKEINESFGAVNFLINGAGGNNPRASTDNETMTHDLEGVKDFFALEESGLKFVFDLNITSAFLVTQVFAQDMIKTGGNIINISSMNAYRPLTKIPAYSAAKAGISNFTQWLAVHFAPCNIRCNAIAPGFFVTNQNRSLLFNEDGMQREIVEEETVDTFINPTIYYETDEYYYIDNEFISEGDIILKPNSQSTYQIGLDKDSLIGVYNINKGYAVFKQINIIYENEQYAIIETKTTYGIALYDHIALDASSVKENQLTSK